MLLTEFFCREEREEPRKAAKKQPWTLIQSLAIIMTPDYSLDA